MSEIVNYTRITTSDRLTDRFLTCQVYSPLDPDQAQSGVIFSQIEILNPWFPTAQIGQSIINTLIREYYRGSDTSELKNFEFAIKKVNDSLAQFAQNGETDWIGKISGVYILVNHRDVHFAQTGHSHAYLYRGAKINHITDDLEQTEAPHPLKTFSNLTSGTLELGDKILIANNKFLEVISAYEAKNIISSFVPALAALQCAKILKSHGAHEANAVILEITTKQDLANLAPEQKIETIYLDQTNLNLSGSFRSAWKKGLSPAFLSIGHFLKDSWQAIRHGSKNLSSKSKAKKDPEPKPTKETTLPQEEQKERAVKAPTLEKKRFHKAKNRLRRYLIRFGLYSKEKSKIILILIGILLVVLLSTLGVSYYKNYRKYSDKELQKTLNEITTLENEAQASFSQNDQKSAIVKYKAVISATERLKGTKYESQANLKKTSAENKINEIAKLSFIDVYKSVPINSGLHLTYGDETIYSISNTGEIQAKKVAADQFEKIANVSAISVKIVSSTYLKSANTIIYSFADNNLASFNPSTKKFQIQPLKLKGSGAIKNFNENLYLLDQTNNQIWKISGESGRFSKVSAYLKDENVIISDGVDLAVDGNLYILSDKGNVAVLSRGKKLTDLQIILPDGETISSCKSIATSEDSDFLYLLCQVNNKTRVIQTQKNGTFSSQLELKGAENPVQAIIDPETDEIFVQTQDKLLAYKLNKTP